MRVTLAFEETVTVDNFTIDLPDGTDLAAVSDAELSAAVDAERTVDGSLVQRHFHTVEREDQ